MKGLGIKICALLLGIWYCFSIIGFDIHTCSASGNVFISTFVDGLTCADIHPEEHCGPSCHYSHEACCHNEHSCCGHDTDHDEHAECAGISNPDSDGCCSDVYKMLVLSGCRAEDDSDDCELISAYYPVEMYADYDFDIKSLKYKSLQFYDPESWDLVPCDLCVAFGVFLI